MTRAFRRWSIDHPAEFALMFGEPIADHPQPDEVLAPPEGAPNFCAAFIAEYAELWRKHRFATPPPEVLHDRFLDRLSPLFAEYRDLLPPEVIYLFLSGWIRLYGLVAMEAFGHLSWPPGSDCTGRTQGNSGELGPGRPVCRVIPRR